MRTLTASHRTIILALCGLVLLLAGVVVGQNLERSRAGVARGAPDLASQAAPPPAGDSGAAGTPATLSTTEYWISKPDMDVTKIGFSVWAVLRPGGNLIVERCSAPRYAMPDDPKVPLSAPLPQCEPIVDGNVARLDRDRLVVRAIDGKQRTMGFSLRRDGGAETLVIDVGAKVKLVPGGKNTLFQRLQALPADEEARNRYMRRMLAGTVGGAPGEPAAGHRGAP